MRNKLLILSLILALWAGLAYGWSRPKWLMGDTSTDPRAVTSDSNIYLIAWNMGDFNFVRSTDNGATWSDQVQPSDTFYMGSTAPDISCTPNGLIHVVWAGQYEEIPWASFIFHQSSSDGGRHWSNRHKVFNSSSLDANHPKLANKGDTLFVAVSMDLKIVTFRSFNRGLTWRDSTIVDRLDISPQHISIYYSQGRLHVIYDGGTRQIGRQVFYSSSDDLGLTWSTRLVLSNALPPYYPDNQTPWAYADTSGHIVAVWYSYEYGSMCGVNGDILGRISTDNGESWLPETRLTYTQSGNQPKSLILGDSVLVVWPDTWPIGCDYPKTVLSYSTNWGESWSEPQLVDGPLSYIEHDPFLCATQDQSTTYTHCFLRILDYPNGYGIYYLRDKPFSSKLMPLPPASPVILSLNAYPNVFNSSTIISYENSEGGDIELSIYNLLGQVIWTNTFYGREGEIIWDASSFPSGVYFAKAEAGGVSKTIKLILLK